MSTADNHEHHDHVMPIKVYFAVFAALLVLTVVTVGVSYMGLPTTLSIITALSVATIKGGFVVGYFMHLKFEPRFNSVVFFSSIVFVAIFFAITMADLTTRTTFEELEGTHRMRLEKKLKVYEQQEKLRLDSLKKTK